LDGQSLAPKALTTDIRALFPSHVVLAALICDRLSMDEQREFLHGDYNGVSHNQEVWT